MRVDECLRVLLADAQKEVVDGLADGVVGHVDARNDLWDDVEPRVDWELVEAILMTMARARFKIGYQVPLCVTRARMQRARVGTAHVLPTRTHALQHAPKFGTQGAGLGV